VGTRELDYGPQYSHRRPNSEIFNRIRVYDQGFQNIGQNHTGGNLTSSSETLERNRPYDCDRGQFAQQSEEGTLFSDTESQQSEEGTLFSDIEYDELKKPHENAVQYKSPTVSTSRSAETLEWNRAYDRDRGHFAQQSEEGTLFSDTESQQSEEGTLFSDIEYGELKRPHEDATQYRSPSTVSTFSSSSQPSVRVDGLKSDATLPRSGFDGHRHENTLVEGPSRAMYAQNENNMKGYSRDAGNLRQATRDRGSRRAQLKPQPNQRLESVRGGKSSTNQGKEEFESANNTMTKLVSTKRGQNDDPAPDIARQPSKALNEMTKDSITLEKPQTVFSSLRKTINTIPSSEVVEFDSGSPKAVAVRCGWTTEHSEYAEIQQNLLTVVSFLGHGSLGVVEEVRVPHASRVFLSFVRKRVKISRRSKDKTLQIVQKEAAALEALRHAHIIKIIGSYLDGLAQGQQFYSLLMFPVGQRDLKTLLELDDDEQLAAKRKIWFPRWFQCLSSALAYMHSRGVRHQDIKPSNIVHRGEDIFFTDFSSAGMFTVGQITSTENPSRSALMYAAPERFSSEEGFMRHGRGTDVFGLGAVFCEMLAVLVDHSVEDFHHFVLEKTKSDLHSLPGARLVYAQSTTAIGEFFSPNHSQHVFAKVHRYLFRDTLAVDRDRRPDAATLAHNIRIAAPFIWTMTDCSCDTMVRQRAERVNPD
jgi:hypothetical protein